MSLPFPDKDAIRRHCADKQQNKTAGHMRFSKPFFRSPLSTRSGRQCITVIMLMAALVLGVFIPRIEYRSEITDYFPAGDDKIVEFNTLEKSFGKQDNFIVLVDFGQQQATSLAALTSLLDAIKSLEAMPGVQSVRSLLDFPVSLPDNDSGQTTSIYRLLETRAPQIEQAQAQAQLADAMQSPTVWLSRNGHVTSMQIQFYANDQRDAAYQQVIAFLDAQQAFRTFRSGPLEIQKELQRSLLHDGLYLMPLVILVGVMLMWVFLRSWWLIAAGTFAIIVALLMTAGVTGLLGMSVNQTSVLAFGIVFIVTLAEVIHVLMGYLYASQTQPRAEAMQSTLSHNLGSLFLTSFTTFLGFISLNISNSPAFAVFGNIASIGVSFAFFATVAILPTLCERAPAPRLHAVADNLQKTLARLSQFPLQNPGASLTIVLLLTLFALPGLARNFFQNDPLDYFDTTTHINKTTHALESNFNVKHHITLHIRGKRPDAAISHYTLATLGRFRQWAESQPDITYILGYDTTLARLQSNLHENDLRWLQVPSQTAAIGELLSVYQMASPHNSLRSLGLSADVRNAVLTVGIPPLSSQQMAALGQRMHDWFSQQAPQLDVSVTGHAPLFANIGLSLTRNMVLGDITTVAVITLVLAWGLRSLRLGLISLIPNIIPPAVIYGVWGYLTGKIDIAAAGAFSMGMGIIVDDTIHIMRNYVIFRRAGHDPDASLRLTFEHSGPALVLTTLVLSGGLGVLCLAKFGPNQVTAQLMASTIALALVYDLCLLPLVLKWTDRAALSLSPADKVLSSAPLPHQSGC